MKLGDVERCQEGGAPTTVTKVVKQEDLAAANVFAALKARRDGGEKDLDEEDDEAATIMGPAEVDALKLFVVIPPKERADIKKYGLTKEKFVEIFHPYSFQQDLFWAVVNLRGKESAARFEAVQTACVGAKYCFSPTPPILTPP